MPGAGIGYSKLYTVCHDDDVLIPSLFRSVRMFFIMTPLQGSRTCLNDTYKYSLEGYYNETTGNNGYFDGSGH